MPGRGKTQADRDLQAVIGNRLGIAADREYGEFSRTAQAEILGIPLATWLETRNGHRLPSLARLVHYASLLGVTVAWLCGEEPE